MTCIASANKEPVHAHQDSGRNRSITHRIRPRPQAPPEGALCARGRRLALSWIGPWEDSAQFSRPDRWDEQPFPKVKGLKRGPFYIVLFPITTKPGPLRSQVCVGRTQRHHHLDIGSPLLGSSHLARAWLHTHKAACSQLKRAITQDPTFRQSKKGERFEVWVSAFMDGSNAVVATSFNVFFPNLSNTFLINVWTSAWIVHASRYEDSDSSPCRSSTRQDNTSWTTSTAPASSRVSSFCTGIPTSKGSRSIPFCASRRDHR